MTALNAARPGGRPGRAATDGTGLTATQEYNLFLGVRQPQRPTTPLVGRDKIRDLAAILADMDRAFKAGKIELAGLYLKEWRAAQQGGAA